MSPFGRKRPFISLVFAVPERPLSGKADIQISVAKNSCGAAAFGRKRLEAFTTAARKVPGSLSRSFSRPREIKKPPEPLELVVPGAGIEPALPLRNRILSPIRYNNGNSLQQITAMFSTTSEYRFAVRCGQILAFLAGCCD